MNNYLKNLSQKQLNKSLQIYFKTQDLIKMTVTINLVIKPKILIN